MAIQKTAANYAQIFHALSDEKRLAILDLLRAGERCVCDIAGPIGMKQSLLSFHLKVLREAGLLRSARVGKWIHYSIHPEAGDVLESFGRELAMSAMSAKVVFCC